MTFLIGLVKNWQSNCNGIGTMKNNHFETIFDAYQLVSGAKIKGKQQDEIFELGTYDALKRSYTLYPLDHGIRYDDFSVLVSERELKNNFMIEAGKGTAIAA
jgi:hypothetical protein